MRVRLSEVQLSIIIDSLQLREEEATQLLIQNRNSLSWQRVFALERTIAAIRELRLKLQISLKRYGEGSWCTSTPITDLVLRKELKQRF
ncbi:MAG: hypothetical protein QXU45_01875 [Candidatus Bathyarchaeia archaeon]